MTVYHPAPQVLPEYTDESLSDPQSEFGRGFAALLLTIPAEYRQSAMAEVAKRTTQMRPYRAAGRTVGSFAVFETVDTGRDENAAVIAEIRTQLGLTST